MHRCPFIPGLKPFTLTHGGPSAPGVRLAAAVTDPDATLGTPCLARTSGAECCPPLTEPSVARHTRDPMICPTRQSDSLMICTTIAPQVHALGTSGCSANHSNDGVDRARTQITSIDDTGRYPEQPAACAPVQR